MNIKTCTRLLFFVLAPLILSAAGINDPDVSPADVSSAQAEDGYWKLEKRTSTPKANPANRLPGNIEICQEDKMGTVELTWTELPDIVIPNKKYSVTVNAVTKKNLSQRGPYWNLNIYFTPRWPSGGGALCSTHAGGIVHGSLPQGSQTGTYEYPKGNESGKSQIQARIETSCTFYDFIYTWYSGPPPTDAGGTENPPPGKTAGPGGGTKTGGAPGGGMALRADTVKAAIGEMITVPIYLDNSTGLANLNFNLVYDSRMVAVGNTAKGNLVPAATSLAANARQAGLVRIGLAGGQDITGSGILVRIPFLPLKALGTAGGRTDLKLEITTTGSASGGKPAVRAIDGWIELGGPGGGGGMGTGGIPPGGGTGTGGAPGTGEAPGGSGGTKPASGIPGDFNGNGVLEAIDALQALKMSVGLIPENLICDVDGDGKVTSTDARLILMKVVGK